MHVRQQPFVGDLALVDEAKTPRNRLGLAVLLAWFRHHGRFPAHKHEVPAPILAFVATQVDVPPEAFLAYDWGGRTFERHRALIRHALGFREATVPDAAALTDWLVTTQLSQQRQLDTLGCLDLPHDVEHDPLSAGARSQVHRIGDRGKLAARSGGRSP